jgi:succinyl-diaminopimelate desuccinylase
MTRALGALRTALTPRFASRVTAMPVVPPAACVATLNVNAIAGGQWQSDIQTPCVADRCRAVLDRRFLIEEPFKGVKDETIAILDDLAREQTGFRYDVEDLLVIDPVQTPADSPVLTALDRATARVLGRTAVHVASPGTYDHKHVARIAGIPHCAAYGPGRLELAHQPDEWCSIEDLITATKVLALAVLELSGTR